MNGAVYPDQSDLLNTDQAKDHSPSGQCATEQSELQAILVERDNQLHMARYAFHKVRVKVYMDAIQIGLMGVEEARHHYQLAMINYDSLIAKAVGGTMTEADEADMVKGFPA
jgi:hypothetical protein